MEINNDNLIAAYIVADERGKTMLRALFPGIHEMHEAYKSKPDNRPVTERIKTFEDACEALGEDHPFVVSYDIMTEKFNPQTDDADIIAYLKLRIITAALNEGWEPQFTEDEERWFPWFVLGTAEELAGKDEQWQQERHLQPMDNHRGEWAGLASASSNSAPSNTAVDFGSRLCFRTESLSDYAGKQFADLWMDFYLIRK